jgi:flavin-dependent dehydrogenase
MNYDVIVIGAGPAGSTVSILLARAGLRVLALEKSRFPREKLCGEFITPECLNIFDRLGLRRSLFDAGAQIIKKFTLFSTGGRGVDIPMEWVAEGYDHAIGLSRARMDRILLDRARKSGADVIEGFRASPRLERRNGHCIIEGKPDGETVAQFSSRIVIDASGRSGIFSNQPVKSSSLFKGLRLFGCKIHLQEIIGLGESGELFFFRDGYGGICNVEDNRTNLCFITTEATLFEARGDRELLLDLTMRSNPAARRRLQDAAISGEWLGIGPIIFGRRMPSPGVIAVGDAGAFIDPFTGSGILLALRSGELAAEAIIGSMEAGVSDAYAIAQKYERLHRRHFGRRLFASSLLRRAALNPMTRNLLASTLTRNPSLARMAALLTRQKIASC